MIRRHKLQWFMERIGKRIYRRVRKDKCCAHCQKVVDEGLVLADRQHADYVYSCQNEMGLKYSDKPFVKFKETS